MTQTLTQANNQYFELDGLLDGATKFLADGVTLNPTPGYINNATGTLQVKDATGTACVIGPAGATTAAAAYVAASNGNYRFLITSAFTAPPRGDYTMVIDLTAPGGFVGHWELPAVVRVRTD